MSKESNDILSSLIEDIKELRTGPYFWEKVSEIPKSYVSFVKQCAICDEGVDWWGFYHHIDVPTGFTLNPIKLRKMKDPDKTLETITGYMIELNAECFEFDQLKDVLMRLISKMCFYASTGLKPNWLDHLPIVEKILEIINENEK